MTVVLPPVSLVIGTKDVAVLLGVSERTAARLLATGEIKAFRLRGRLWRTTRMLVNEYIASQIELHQIRA